MVPAPAITSVHAKTHHGYLVATGNCVWLWLIERFSNLRIFSLFSVYLFWRYLLSRESTLCLLYTRYRTFG